MNLCNTKTFLYLAAVLISSVFITEARAQFIYSYSYNVDQCLPETVIPCGESETIETAAKCYALSNWTYGDSYGDAVAQCLQPNKLELLSRFKCDCEQCIGYPEFSCFAQEPAVLDSFASLLSTAQCEVAGKGKQLDGSGNEMTITAVNCLLDRVAVRVSCGPCELPGKGQKPLF